MKAELVTATYAAPQGIIKVAFDPHGFGIPDMPYVARWMLPNGDWAIGETPQNAADELIARREREMAEKRDAIQARND